MQFATPNAAAWTANFRDFNAAVVRMATLAAGGRITAGIVRDEVQRLTTSWQPADERPEDDLLRRFVEKDRWEDMDRFDRVQLAEVLRVCADSRSLSEAGRALFSVSRHRRSTTNDADRLRKYLARFGVVWRDVQT